MTRNTVMGLSTVWVHRSLLVTALVAISLLAVASSQASVVPATNDKLNHFVAFFFLAYCLDGSFRSHRFIPGKLLVLAGYAVLIEVVQRFLPYREFSYLDMLADGVGVCLYWCLRGLMRRHLM